MLDTLRSDSFSSCARSLLVAALLAVFSTVFAAHALGQEDFDEYKLRLDTYWFYSNPSGTIQGQGDTVPIDVVKDFNTYSTFSGKVDWKFTRKNHFYVGISPFYTSRQTTLSKTITFRGQTIHVGSIVQSDLHAFLVAPGYQYDIIRRKRGHLGLGVPRARKKDSTASRQERKLWLAPPERALTKPVWKLEKSARTA